MEMQGLGNSLLASDSRLVDHIVGEVKSQGIFDKFRKECIADVDTKPAYQNLRTRVEGSVNSFLHKQTWRTDLNKNQLRETLRKHIHEAPYLEVGVERIVDQVVNPKIYSVFMPQIEDVVYKFLGIERPRAQKNGACDLKDLLPKDLDPVSPESDVNSFKDVSMESIDDTPIETSQDNQQKPCTSNFSEKTENVENTDKMELSIKKEEKPVEKTESCPFESSSPIKTVLNCSFKSDETNKMEEEEEDSPVFEPIDMHLNESNLSNDSHLSGISELTSHRSRSPDFSTEFSRDNFDCSNQDSQLSKVSSNSRLSIVTDFGSSNHASTPLPECKDDSKNAKEEFKTGLEKDNKFSFDSMMKSKDNSKISNSSKENSRDASDYKTRDESKSRSLKDKHDSSKGSKDRDRDSRRHHSSKSDKYSRSKSKDESQESSQDGKENANRSREGKTKEVDKKDDVKDLKDLYKEKIRELREKKELTEKERLGNSSRDSTKAGKDKDVKDKKDSTSSSREKDESRRGHKSSSSSSSRSSSYHNQKSSSRSSDSKESRERKSSTSSKRDDRRHTNGKSSSRSSSSGKRDSKHENSRSSSSLRDKKRREEKKPSKPTDDHSSLRKSSRDRRSSDRDGSNGSSSKQPYKSAGSSQAATGKLGSAASLALDAGKDQAAGGATSDGARDSPPRQRGARAGSEGAARRVDPGAAEICLPLKKRPLHSDDSSSGESPVKKPKYEVRAPVSRKPNNVDAFGADTDVTCVPDEERVQIVEIADEDYEQPYPNKEEPILSIEETKNIIFNAEPIAPVAPVQSKLSEMEQSIRDSLHEMMSDHGLSESENTLASNKLIPVIDSTSSLLETLTDESNNDLQLSLAGCSNDSNNRKVEKMDTNEEECDDHGLFEAVASGAQEVGEDKIEPKVQEDSKDNGVEEFVKPDMGELHKVETDKLKVEENVEEKVENLNKDIKENLEKSKAEDVKIVDMGVSESDEVCDDLKREMNIIEKNDVSDEIKNDERKVNINDIVLNEKENDKNCDIFDTEINAEVNLEKSENDENSDFEEVHIEYNSIEKSEQDLVDNSENYDVAIKDFTDNPEQKHVDSSDRNIEQPTQSDMNNVYPDEESQDEFNDDKLVIDEEFDDKGNSEKPVDSKVRSATMKKNDEKMAVASTVCANVAPLSIDSNDQEQNQFDEVDQDDASDSELKEDDVKETEELDKQKNDENKVATIDENNRNIEGSIELTNEVGQEQMKEQLIAKLGKLHKDDVSACLEKSEDYKDPEKSTIKPLKISETSIKMDENIDEKQDDTVYCGKNEDLNVELKDNDTKDHNNDKEEEAIDLDSFCEAREDKLAEGNSLVSKVEEPSVSETAQIPSKAPELASLQKLERPTSESELSSDERLTLGRVSAVASPIEEDCLYFIDDNYDKYLEFKCFLEKLEATLSRGRDNEAERKGVESTSKPPSPNPGKRKLSASPQPAVIVKASNNNNNDASADKDTPRTEEPSEEGAAVVKKRKVGRTKKTGQAVATAAALVQAEIHVPQQLQTAPAQPLEQPPPEQPSTTIINGENVIFPLNLENDVAGERNSALKDDKGRHRSNQRYSSDDLYKPRPLFTSSSRRKRRVNNQA